MSTCSHKLFCWCKLTIVQAKNILILHFGEWTSAKERERD